MSREDLHVCVLEKLERWNPFDHPVWWGMKSPITREEVAHALAKGLLQSKVSHIWRRSTRLGHIRRVAYFVQHGWEVPISIDVGIPSLGYHVEWIVDDGNHRLAAAFYRKDPTVRISVSGQIDYAEELLGIRFPEN